MYKIFGKPEASASRSKDLENGFARQVGGWRRRTAKRIFTIIFPDDKRWGRVENFCMVTAHAPDNCSMEEGAVVIKYPAINRGDTNTHPTPTSFDHSEQETGTQFTMCPVYAHCL